MGIVLVVFNVVNEFCVDVFCVGSIGFFDIIDIIVVVFDEYLFGDENDIFGV